MSTKYHNNNELQRNTSGTAIPSKTSSAISTSSSQQQEEEDSGLMTIVGTSAGDGDSSSTSSGSSSSPEVDQHLHQQEKINKNQDHQKKEGVNDSKSSFSSTASSNKPQKEAKDLDDGDMSDPQEEYRAYTRSVLLEIRDHIYLCKEYPTELLPPTTLPLPPDKRWLEDILKTSPTSSSPVTPDDGPSSTSIAGVKGATNTSASDSKKAGPIVSRDPRDRVKQEEQDGIVLSPQRGSFGTGCHGHQSLFSSTLNRPGSPGDRGAPPSMGGSRRGGASIDSAGSSLTSVVHHRSDISHTRRIGSGRIIRRDDIDAPPSLMDSRGGRAPRSAVSGHASELELPDPPRVRESRDWRNKEPQLTHHHLRFDREERFEHRRRGFFEENESANSGGDRNMSSSMRRSQHHDGGSRSMGGNRNRHTYYGGHRHRHEDEETPEWFSGGPTSQNEFIELVGFDGPAPDESGKSSKNNSPSAASKKGSSRPGSSLRSKSPPSHGPASRSSEASSPATAAVSASSASPPIAAEGLQPSSRDSEALPPTAPDVDNRRDSDVDEGAEATTHGPPSIPPGLSESIQFNVEDFLENIIGADTSDTPDLLSSANIPGSHQSKLKQFFSSSESPPPNNAAVMPPPPSAAVGGGGGTHHPPRVAAAGGRHLPPGSEAHVAAMLSEVSLDARGRPGQGSSSSAAVDSSHYFTPINPADPCGPAAGPPSIVDLLQQANMISPHHQGAAPHQQHPMNLPPHLQQHMGQARAHGAAANPPSVKDLLMRGKGHCLEELEAGLLKQAGGSNSSTGGPPPPPHSTNAPPVSSTSAPPIPAGSSNQYMNFNEFLSQVTAVSSTNKGDDHHSNTTSSSHHHQHHHPPPPPPQVRRQGLPQQFFNAAPPMSIMSRPNTAAPPGDDPLAKFLSGGAAAKKAMKTGPPNMGPQPSVPPAPTEADLISMIMKTAGEHGSSNSAAPGGPSSRVMSSSPGPQTLHVPPPSSTGLRPPVPPPPPQQHQSVNNQENVMIWKLLQHQKLQQQQQQQHLKRQALQQALQQQQQSSNDPIKQLVGGLQQQGSAPPPPPQQRVISPHPMAAPNNAPPPPGSGAPTHPSMHHPLQAHALRPDVQNLLQRVSSGQVSDVQLMAQLQNATLPPVQRENISAVLQLLSMPQSSNMLGAPHRNQLTPSPTHKKHRKRDSERGRSPNPAASVAGPGSQPGGMPAVSTATSCATANNPPHSSSSTPPSAHANNKEGSPHKSMAAKSQSPLAFTPTSVMRKMTADRDKSATPSFTSDKNNSSADNKPSDGHPRIPGDSEGPGAPHPGQYKVHGAPGHHHHGPPPHSSMSGPMHHPQSAAAAYAQQHYAAAAAAAAARTTSSSSGPPPPHHPSFSHHYQQQPPPMRPQQQQHYPQQHNNPNAAAALHHLYNNLNNNNTSNNPHHHHHHVYKHPGVELGNGPVTSNSGNNSSNGPNMAINLAQLLASDSLAHVPNLPEVPGINAFSLEEIERLHQHHQQH